jgi:hypothetical protein
MKVRELAQSALVVRDLISKARTTADTSLNGILDRWQVNNDKNIQNRSYDY